VRAGFTALFLAMVGLAVTTLLVAREQVRTSAAYEAEAVQRAEAEENFRQAREAVDFFARVCEDELPDRPETREVRRKLLEGALAYYREFIDRRHDDSKTQTDLAASYFHLAGLLDRIGSRAEAEKAYEQARLLEDKLVRDNRMPPGMFGRGRGWGRSESGVLLLLSQKAVQEELKLSDEQLREVSRLSTRRQETLRDGGRVAEEAQAERERVFVEGLRPEQARRLKQIALQQRGADALADADVSEGLRLTADQREKIRKVLTDSRRSGHGPPGGSGPFGPSEPRKFTDRTDSDSFEQLLRVLTPEQRALWKEMAGEQFRGELWPRFGRDGSRFGRPSGPPP
jgi:tetratricopeptide (TPR) repeat protein